MVCAAHPAAARAGLEMLQLGGNAIDAALAISFTLGVVEPFASGLGGGGFMTIRMADNRADSSAAPLGKGRVVCLDFRERAPAAATPDHYYGTGRSVHDLTLHGPLAVAVPGVPSGLAHAAANFGLLSRQTLHPMIAPAIHHAERGITVTPKMARHFAAYHDFLSRYPTTSRIFTRPHGPIRAGEVLRQPEQAQTLAHISENGLEAFGQGMLAHRLERFMAAHGGLVAANDLAAYRPHERPVIRGTYRGYTLLTTPPPSTGGMRLLQVLNVLERYPVGEWGPHAANTVHLIAEALKASFAAGERLRRRPRHPAADSDGRTGRQTMGSRPRAATCRSTRPIRRSRRTARPTTARAARRTTRSSTAGATSCPPRRPSASSGVPAWCWTAPAFCSTAR